MDNKQAAVDAVHMERMEDTGQERGSGSGKDDRRGNGPVQSDCAADESDRGVRLWQMQQSS